MKEKIIELIIRLTECEELHNDPDINLIEEEILDSFAFIELIEELEDTFDIEIQPTQLPPDTWGSVDKICKMVMAVKNAQKHS